MPPDERKCPRCGGPLHHFATSWFNLEQICTECLIEEKDAPNWQRAIDAENNAVRCGEHNFPGIGLTPEDAVYLAFRRSTRRST